MISFVLCQSRRDQGARVGQFMRATGTGGGDGRRVLNAVVVPAVCIGKDAVLSLESYIAADGRTSDKVEPKTTTLSL